MESASSSKAAPSAPGGFASIAAKAAAAAQAVAAANHAKAGAPSHISASSSEERPPPAADSTGQGSSQPSVSSMPMRPIFQPPDNVNEQKPTRQPQMFCMDADDTMETSFDYSSTIPDHSPMLPGHFELNSPTASGLEPGLSLDEEREYEAIEERFKRFRQHQNEVESKVALLLNRLNTQIRVPSSVASSECGSRASSEWDTESLGPTDDGLSILDSPLGSPRSTLLQKAATSDLQPRWEELNPELRSAAEKLTPSERVAFGVMPKSSPSGTPPETVREKMQQKRPSIGGSVAAERGDFLGARASPYSGGSPKLSPNGSASGSADVPSLILGEKISKPHLSPMLLKQSGLDEVITSPERFEKAISPPPGDSSPHFLPPHQTSAASAMAGALPAVAVPPPDSTASLQMPAMTSSPLRSMGSPGDADDDEDITLWRGWTVVATQEGRLFYHNEAAQLSQWSQPHDLVEVLGEWEEIYDSNSPETPPFFRNEMLGVSLWKDPRQTTNIFQAALDGNLFFLQLYAEVEGQLDVVDPKGRGALHYACAGGATQSAVFLLQRQAQVNRPDETASTPLIFACRYGFASIVKLLLDAQANLDHGNDRGNTALHEAASMGQLDCLHLLLLCGANANSRNADGECPADIAAAKNHYPSLTLLKRHMQNTQRGPEHPPVPPVGMAGPARRLSESSAPEVPPVAFDSDPFANATSSSDPSRVATTAAMAHGSAAGGFDLASAVAAQAGAASGTGDSHFQSQPSGMRQRGQRGAGRSSKFAARDSDSESDPAAKAVRRGNFDSGASSSEDSPQRSHGRHGRRHDRSPNPIDKLSRKLNIPRQQLVLGSAGIFGLLLIWILGLMVCIMLALIIVPSVFFLRSTEMGRSIQSSCLRGIASLAKALEPEDVR